ncbi:MAG: nitroreductase family deazaflavin-dependent oxidoreductase [Candidatus Nanopelagicales bacterium]
MKRFTRITGLLVMGILTLGVVWFLGMRRKGSVITKTQRRINRAVFNPRQLRTAGQPGAYAGVVHHQGRVSGRQYRTPVGTVPTEDGFVVALVYGSDTDWVKNVLAADSAVITHEGRQYEVGDPALISLDSVADSFDDSELQTLRLFGVQECLRLRRVSGGQPQA